MTYPETLVYQAAFGGMFIGFVAGFLLCAFLLFSSKYKP